jgi:hypothetical protein
MKSSNITIKIKSDLAREATLFAARRGISLSRLVEEQLETAVREDQAYAASRQRALRQLKKGFDLGWKKRQDRNELHDR